MRRSCFALLSLFATASILLARAAGALIGVGALDTPGLAFDVEVVGERAYVAAFESGLRVIDVSNPALPVELGALGTPGVAVAVEVVGELAYVADGFSGLRVIDVSDPALPVELGALDTPDFADDVEVVGELAYLGDWESGLRVIDVSNPALPLELGAVGPPDRAGDVEVVGELAYVGDFEFGLRVIDVSNSAFPVELGALETLGYAYDVDVVNARAYVADGVGLRVIDVSNPAFPVELGTLSTPGSARDVEVVGGLAYVADSFAGLRIIDLGPEYAGPSAVRLEIDIKPGSHPNSIHPSRRGNLPVAILGSDAFDVASIAVATLTFGPGGASFAHRNGPHLEDVDGDGLTDLLAHYRVEEAGIATGDAEACVSGQLLDGTPFEGCDGVRAVPNRDRGASADANEATVGADAPEQGAAGDGFEDG